MLNMTMREKSRARARQTEATTSQRIARPTTSGAFSKAATMRLIDSGMS